MAGGFAALFLGALFGTGLVVGGMTQPSKVIGFLDVAGDWDPSLLFVMGGAVLVYLATFRWISGRSAPVLGTSFALPRSRRVDRSLVLGSALFGVGWGLAGFCPGPALVSMGSFGIEALVFTAAMFGGFLVHRLVTPKS